MIDDKLTAFPNQRAAPDVDGFMSTRGMTLRDYFAAKAMQSVIVADYSWACSHPDGVARTAFIWADAMLAERAKGKS